jgi:glycosyltransferase involved in cell wall biosynthesis
MKISVLIPCYNEENTIKKVIKLVKESLSTKDYEIIVVDDASTDKTKEILNVCSHIEENVKVVIHEKNNGKGASVRTGLNYVTGDIVIIQDADLEYDPTEYNKLFKPILMDKADVVYGSRFKNSGETRVLYYWHQVGNVFLTWLSNVFTNMNLTDMETCYKIFRREVLEQITIEENRFGFEPEITAKIAKIRPKIRIYEVGISYYGRTYEEGKKITWKVGIGAVNVLINNNKFP